MSNRKRLEQHLAEEKMLYSRYAALTMRTANTELSPKEKAELENLDLQLMKVETAVRKHWAAERMYPVWYKLGILKVD